MRQQSLWLAGETAARSNRFSLDIQRLPSIHSTRLSGHGLFQPCLSSKILSGESPLQQAFANFSLKSITRECPPTLSEPQSGGMRAKLAKSSHPSPLPLGEET